MQSLPPLPPVPELPPRPDHPLSDAMYEIADALHYPVDPRGRVYDVKFMLPTLAYHLARAGARIIPELAVIKQRRLPLTPGVVEDAVEWVPIDAPESVEDELAGATLADLGRLSPSARAELIRRLGGEPPSSAPAPQTGWHVETSIHFDDEDEDNN